MWKTAVEDSSGAGTTRSCSQGAALASSYVEKAVRVVLLVYLAVLPFRGLLVIERNGFLVLLGLLLVWCLLNGRLFYRKTPYDIPLVAFVIWVSFTLPFSSFPQYSVKEFGRLLQWMVVFYGVLAFFHDPAHRRVLLSTVGLASLGAVTFGLTDVNVTNPQLVIGPFPAEVWFTTFLVIVIPFGLVTALGESPRAFKRFGAMFSVFATLCLLATQSRAGLTALVVELVAMAWLIRTKAARIVTGLVTCLLVIAIVVGLYVKTSMPDENSHLQESIPLKTGVATIVHRLDIWKFTLSEIAKHWLVGIGYGANAYLYLYGEESETVEEGHVTVKSRGTHNILLYLALHVGVIGLFLFLWFYLSVLRRTLQEFRAAGDWAVKTILGGTLVSMIGLFVRLQFDQMFVGTLATMFWVLLAIAIIHYPSMNEPASEHLRE